VILAQEVHGMPQKLVRRAQQLLRKALLAECGARLRIRDGNLAPLRVPMSICCCTASEYARSRAASAFRSRPARSTLMPLIVPDNCPAAPSAGAPRSAPVRDREEADAAVAPPL